MLNPDQLKAVDPGSQLQSLTSFRGLAAFWVVLYHYGAIYFSQLNPSNYTHLIEKGYLAVDLFFMLSGFVLTHVYRRSFTASIRQHYKGFFLSRIAGLYPLHIFVLLLFLTTALTSQLIEYMATGASQPIPLEGPRSLGAFAANLFMLQGLKAGQLSWNYPAWSISTEFIAYLLFPFMLSSLWKSSHVSKAVSATFLIAVLTLFAYLNRDNFNQWDGPQTLLRCLLEFMLGSLLYSAFRNVDFSSTINRDWVAVSMLAITIAALHFGVPDILIVLLFAALILTVVANTHRVAEAANLSLLVRLGNISYSVYLLHGFIQFVVGKLLMTCGIYKGTDLSTGPSVSYWC